MANAKTYGRCILTLFTTDERNCCETETSYSPVNGTQGIESKDGKHQHQANLNQCFWKQQRNAALNSDPLIIKINN